MIKRCIGLGLVACAAVPAGAILNGGDASEFGFVGQAGDSTGVVVAPNWVITARHVGATSFVLNGTTYVPDQIINADGVAGRPISDLTLMHFTNTFSTFSTPIYSDPIGVAVSMVGFGELGTFRANGTGYEITGAAGVRRRAWNTVSGFADVPLPFLGNAPVSTFLYDLDGNGIDTFSDGGPVLVNGNSAEGGWATFDSGGGMFVDSGGQWRLVGVASFVFDQDGNGNNFDFGDGGGAVRLTAYQAWIEANIHPVPEPATMLMLGAGVAGILARRRRIRK